MARLPRITVPDFPHHVTQRGNHRQRVFLQDDDYALYKDWLAQACRANGVLETALEKGQTIGRPLMDESALIALEKRLERPLRPGKRGRPKAQRDDPHQQQLV